MAWFYANTFHKVPPIQPDRTERERERVWNQIHRLSTVQHSSFIHPSMYVLSIGCIQMRSDIERFCRQQQQQTRNMDHRLLHQSIFKMVFQGKYTRANAPYFDYAMHIDFICVQFIYDKVVDAYTHTPIQSHPQLMRLAISIKG